MPAPRPEDARDHIDQIIAAALAAADPARAVAAALDADPGPLRTGAFAVLALGKAAAPMAHAASAWGRDRIAAVTIIAPHAPGPSHEFPAPTTILIADHPEPSERSVAAGSAALELADRCRAQRLPLLVLLSGGASSLACVPEPGLTVEHLAAITRDLQRVGAPIDELNVVRSHADRLKAGGLAAAAAPAPLLTLILSDVLGDRLDLIGSGPTAPPQSAPADALAVLKRRRLTRRHADLAAHLRLRSASPGALPNTSNASSRVIAGNATALDAAAASSRALGYRVVEAKPGITGEAREAGFAFAGALRRARNSGDLPAAIMWGGETVVTVSDKPAPRRRKPKVGPHARQPAGGRNQEAALSAAVAIDNDHSLVIATFATDGLDGPPPSDAAGAIVDGRTASEARRAGLDPEDALAAHDSYHFFKSRGGHIVTGPTRTNVNDLWIGLAY